MSDVKRNFFGNAFFALCCSGGIGFCAYLVRRLTANGLQGNEYAFFYSTFSLVSILISVVALGIPNAVFFALPDLRTRGLNDEAHGAYAFCLRWVLVTGLLLSAICLPLIFSAGGNLARYGIEDGAVFYLLLLP